MDRAEIEKLEGIMETAAKGLPKVTSKKMFGCQALWANGNVFALVWKHGRLGVKLPDEKDFGALIKKSGAEPWKAGPMVYEKLDFGFHRPCTRKRQTTRAGSKKPMRRRSTHRIAKSSWTPRYYQQLCLIVNGDSSVFGGPEETFFGWSCSLSHVNVDQ